MKDLTPQQLSSIWRAQTSSGKGSGFYDIIRAAIKAEPQAQAEPEVMIPFGVLKLPAKPQTPDMEASE